MNALINFLLSLVGKKPTVDAVLGTFNSAVKTLDALQGAHQADIDKHNAAAEKLAAKVEHATSEIAAAATVAQNLRAILGK